MAQGKVESIQQKTTKAGAAMYSVVVNGQKYGVFENPGVAVGDDVTFDAIQKGEFWNAKNFRGGSMLANGAMTSAFPTPAPWTKPANGNGHTADPEREARIVRQNATSSAATLIAALVSTQKEAWDVESMKKATFELSKDIFEVNFKGYDAGQPF